MLASGGGQRVFHQKGDGHRTDAAGHRRDGGRHGQRTVVIDIAHQPALAVQRHPVDADVDDDRAGLEPVGVRSGAGRPTAATTISARRHKAGASWLRECTTVTVQSACSSSAAIGLPTMFERPMTTACLPDRSPQHLFQQVQAAAGRAGREHRLAQRQAADVVTVETVDILGRVDGQDHGGLLDLRWQRQLHQNAIHRGIAVELPDQFEQRGLRRIRWQAVLHRADADLLGAQRSCCAHRPHWPGRHPPAPRPAPGHRPWLAQLGHAARTRLPALRQRRPCRRFAAHALIGKSPSCPG